MKNALEISKKLPDKSPYGNGDAAVKIAEIIKRNIFNEG